MTNRLSKDCRASEEKKRKWKENKGKGKGKSKGKGKGKGVQELTEDSDDVSEPDGGEMASARLCQISDSIRKCGTTRPTGRSPSPLIQQHAEQ